MKRCLVLLCTYNGEKNLREQLDSILSQKDVEVSIKAADDRSTDGTKEILKEYAEKYPAFTYSVNEKNKGFCYNFLDLIFSVRDTDYDYYALSDQDDVWLPEKLKRAAEQIEGKGETKKGVMYCSNLIVSDEKLNPIRMMEEGKNLKINRYTAAFSNVATGCTIVFDKKFLLQCTKHYPQGLQLHDDWLYLLAMYTADFIYDREGYIRYRQHTESLIGSGDKPKQNKYSGWPCVSEIIALYRDELGKRDLKTLVLARDYIPKFSCKLKIIFSTKYYRSRFGFRFRLEILREKER